MSHVNWLLPPTKGSGIRAAILAANTDAKHHRVVYIKYDKMNEWADKIREALK